MPLFTGNCVHRSMLRAHVDQPIEGAGHGTRLGRCVGSTVTSSSPLTGEPAFAAGGSSVTGPNGFNTNDVFYFGALRNGSDGRKRRAFSLFPFLTETASRLRQTVRGRQKSTRLLINSPSRTWTSKSMNAAPRVTLT